MNAIAHKICAIANSAASAEALARRVDGLLYIERRHDCGLVSCVFIDHSRLVIRGDSHIAVDVNDARSLGEYADWLGADAVFEQALLLAA